VARNYLEQVVTIMQNNSIKRLTIDWTAFRTEVFEAARDAQTITETLPAIRVAIARIGDGHSSYRSISGTVIFVANRTCSGSGGPSSAGVPDSIGYVTVSAFSGTPTEATAFANNIQSVIRAADREGLTGWLVDLRGNGGGNMWPMVAGLGPVLGDGILGYFFTPTGVETRWEYHDGASWIGSTVAQRVDAPYRLRRALPRVAVIVDNLVASSGEATYVAFRQRADTRSFGVATCGLSTSNSTFTLTDGATLTLTTAVMADRTRQAYGDRIAPDEVITEREQVLPRAIAWLQTGR
jgi:C-terminal processing protease CtpA/Prc